MSSNIAYLKESFAELLPNLLIATIALLKFISLAIFVFGVTLIISLYTAVYVVPQKVAEQYCIEPDAYVKFENIINLGREPGLSYVTITRTGPVKGEKSMTLTGSYVDQPSWRRGEADSRGKEYPLSHGRHLLRSLGYPRNWSSGRLEFVVFGALFWRCGCQLDFTIQDEGWLVTSSNTRCYD